MSIYYQHRIMTSFKNLLYIRTWYVAHREGQARPPSAKLQTTLPLTLEHDSGHHVRVFQCFANKDVGQKSVQGNVCSLIVPFTSLASVAVYLPCMFLKTLRFNRTHFQISHHIKTPLSFYPRPKTPPHPDPRLHPTLYSNPPTISTHHTQQPHQLRQLWQLQAQLPQRSVGRARRSVGVAAISRLRRARREPAAQEVR